MAVRKFERHDHELATAFKDAMRRSILFRARGAARFAIGARAPETLDKTLDALAIASS